jgi:uncharacterized protein (TIRG00374 family)
VNRFVRVSVAIVLLAFLIVAVDWRGLPAYLRQIDAKTIVIALAGYGCQFVLSGWKWGWALRVLRVDLPNALLIRLYCISHFIGQFLPTAVGGDAYRALRTSALVPSTTRAVSAIALERIVGLAVLMAIGAIAAWQLSGRFLIAHTFLIALFVASVVALALFVAIWRGLLKRLTAPLQRFSWFQALRQDFQLLLSAKGSTWLAFLALSLIFQLTSIGIVYALFAGTGSNASPSQVALIAALAGLAGILPISINGLGVVEGSFAGAAVALGLDPAQALLTAILARFLVLPWTIGCGLLYLAEKPGPAPSPPRSI